MHLIIVEDTGFKKLLPLTATRPTFDLLCGTISLADRVERFIPRKRVSYIMRDDFRTIYADRYPMMIRENPDADEALYVNSRVVWDEVLNNSIRKIIRKRNSCIVRSNDDWVAVYRTSSNSFSHELFETIPLRTPEGFAEETVRARIISYPWDIIDANADCITTDYMYRVKRIKNKIQGNVHPRALLTQKKNILIGKKTTINPYVVIDASKGPVIIENNVTVQPHVFIQGPVWINAETIIKSGARIYGGTSIGFNCRAAGEITTSIIHSYSNKGHEGFLGHSYLGQWINIGAHTNNSNLKNDYGPIRVMINGNPVESGKQFFGMVMGDHSRTGINTMINTGTNIGVACNIFGADFPPKYIPDFSWGGAAFLREYQFEKFLQNAHAMTARRGVTLSEAEIQLLRKLYESRKTK